MTTRARREVVFLLALLASLLIPKVAFTALVHGTSVDGGYYTDVAEHVRDGDGLVSDVSLYHAGVPAFPHATPIYPLWPLLLGAVARVVDIEILVHWLPAALYVVSLVGAFLFGRALFPGDLFRVSGLNAGHLLALMLSIQHEYFHYTSLPYTEGLATVLLMFGLWRVVRSPEGSAVELGVWMALLVLTRSQMLFVPVAAALAFAARAARGDPQRTLGRAAVALAIVGAALGGWWFRNRGIVVDSGLGSILRFDQAQVTTLLPPIAVLAPTSGPLDFLLDRLGGVLVAFDPTGWDHSYARGFYTLQWALPCALLVGVIRIRTLRLPVDPFVGTFLVFVSLGALLSVHLPHKMYFGEWYFHRRHAIPCVVPFFLALVYLLRSPTRFGRVLGVAITLSSIALGVAGLADEVTSAWRAPRHEPEDDVVAWLDARKAAEGPLVVAVAAFVPPELAWRTEDIGYHWFYERTRLADLDLMFDALGARYLLFDPKKTKRWLFRESGFDQEFVRLPDAPGGYAVYRRRPDVASREP